MSRDPQIKRYEVDNSHFAEMKEIGMQDRIRRNQETAILHDPRPTTSPDARYEAYVGGQKVGSFTSQAEAVSAINREP